MLEARASSLVVLRACFPRDPVTVNTHAHHPHPQPICIYTYICMYIEGGDMRIYLEREGEKAREIERERAT